MRKKMFVLLVAFVAVFSNGLSLSPLLGQVVRETPKSKPESKPVKPLAAANDQKLPPVVVEAMKVRQKRMVLLNQTIKEIDADLEILASSIDASDFADEAIDWNSAWQVVTGDSSHRTWLCDRFDSLVIGKEDVNHLLQNHVQPYVSLSRDLSKAMYKWSSKLGALHKAREFSIDLTPFLQARTRAIDEASAYASNAPVEKMGTILFGIFVGAAAQSLVDGDEPTWNGTLAGFGADLAAGEAVSMVLDTHGKLTKAIDDTLKSKIRSMKSTGANANCWLDGLKAFTAHEQRECEKAVGGAFYVDIEQAIAGQPEKK